MSRLAGTPCIVTSWAERAGLVAALGALWAAYVGLRPLGIHVSDSYAWVNTVETEAFGYFFHPHHVLYLALAWRWNELAQWMAPGVSTWGALAALSATAGCAGAAAVYATLRRLGYGARAAGAGTAVTVAPFGYWFFSSEPEVYVLSAACALWALYFVARFAGEARARMLAWAGAAAGLAALFHQTGVFLFAPAAAAAWMMRKQAKAWTALGGFAAAFGAVAAPVYLAAAWASTESLSAGEVWRWVFQFGYEGYGDLSARGALAAPVGLLRAAVGGQAILDTLREARPADAAMWCGTACAVAAAVTGGVVALTALGAAKRMEGARRVTAVSAACAVAAYAAFSVYFDPGNFEWWTIPLSIACVAALVPALEARKGAVAAAGLAVSLVGANLLLDVTYRREAGNDIVRNAAQAVAAVTSPEDVVIAPGYLATVLWREGVRHVVCPEEEARLNGTGALETVIAAAAAAGRRGGRVILAGAERDEAFARDAEAEISKAERSVAGKMVFFDGRRGIVDKVSQVDIVAVEPGGLMAAAGQ